MGYETGHSGVLVIMHHLYHDTAPFVDTICSIPDGLRMGSNQHNIITILSHAHIFPLLIHDTNHNPRA